MRTEKALAAARSALEGIDNELRGYEQTRHQRDEQALAQRESDLASASSTSRRW